MENVYFRKIMTSIVLVALIVLSLLLLRPIILSIITGIILAFIFYPLYHRLNCRIKSKNISAMIMCLFLILLIVVPLWFLTPVVIDQTIKIFIAYQEINLVEYIESVFPSLFFFEGSSQIVQSVIDSLIEKAMDSSLSFFSIDNIMNYFLKSLVVFFTFFFVLRDKHIMLGYLKSLSPFSKEIEDKLFSSSKAITNSVIYGQVVIGIVQGLLVGLGLFIFGVPNALLLTLLACLAGIFPVIGTALVWAPVTIYLFVVGTPFAAFGVLIFGVISSSADNVLRPIIVSKRAKMNSLLIIIGMVGGLFLFGILGFILGPLILAYLLIILEIYRNKKVSNLFMEQQVDDCPR